jgi:Protein of unknown function (DUF3768)
LYNNTMSTTFNTNQMAVEILQATNDGDDLISRHLQLLEDAVNGFLDDDGINKFKELYETVRAGYFENRSKKIAELNDQFRSTFNRAAGEVLATQGVMALPLKEQAEIFKLVQTFNSFNADNDPYKEHDCATIKHKDNSIIWKIDCYDTDLQYGSEDPAE